MKKITQLLAAIAITAGGIGKAAAQDSYPDIRLVETLTHATHAALLLFEPVSDNNHATNEFLVKVPEGSNLKECDLFAAGFDERKSEVVKCCVGAQGYLVLPGATSPLRIRAETHFPGEAVRFYAVATTFTSALTGSIVPRPVRVAQHGYTLEVVTPGLDYQLFSVEAAGFEPYEWVSVTSKSGAETIPIERLQAGPDGQLMISSAPATIGAAGGQFQITITGKKGAAIITSPWGAEYPKFYNKRFSEEHVIFNK